MGFFINNPLRYINGEHKVIKDINFEGMTYDNFYTVLRRLVLEPPLGIFYVLPGVPMNIGVRPVSDNDQLNDFVQALYENDYHLDLYTEHQGYDVLEMINDDNMSEDKSDSDFEDVEKGDILDDVKDFVDFQTEGDENVDIPRLTTNDPWLNKLVGKGRFVGETEDPIPVLKGRFFIEEEDPEYNYVEPKYRVQPDFQYPSFDPDTPWNECNPILGMKFESPGQLKQCLANYGVTHGYQLWYMQNDTYKLLVNCGRDVSAGKCAGKRGKKPVVIDDGKGTCSAPKNKNGKASGSAPKNKNGKASCSAPKIDKGKGKVGEESSVPVKNAQISEATKERWRKKKLEEQENLKNVVDCPFRLWASWMSSEKSFQIKSLYPDHKCCRNYNLGSLVTYRWIAEHYAREIIDNPWVSYQYMQNAIRSKFMINVSLGQCKRAKQVALFDHEGGLIDHYSRIWEYRQAILDSNPGSTCHIDLEEKDDGETYFKRFYVCFFGLKNGWLEGCRKVIGLDGCFLTHTCKGQLLTAIGRDANNQMFPIAWAVVGVENKNNWSWFLSLLSDDLKLGDGLGLTVISDGHKGLLDAVKIWLPSAEHIQCTRHIYANFKKKWCGLHYKRLFWRAASCTMNEQFIRAMDEIKVCDEKAYTWLIDHDPNTWCRAYFEMGRSCGAFENGISESFNSKIISARGKPIITMLEDIRVYLMQRVWCLNKIAMDLNDAITPYARKHVELMKIRQRKWKVYASGYQEVEVRRQDEAFGVNLHLKKCACRMWELTGLPCVHAVAGYTHLKKDPELGVTAWYSKSKWVDAYEYSIRPVAGTKLWKKCNLPKPLPPGERKLPGRPKKRRIRHPSEFGHGISRVGRVMHCHRCWQTGHNKAKCVNAPKPKPANFYPMNGDEPVQDEVEKDQYQAGGPSVPVKPVYMEDPVMPSSNQASGPSVPVKPVYMEDPVMPSSNQASGPSVPSSSQGTTSQVNDATGSKIKLTAKEHAEMMDREAFAEMVRIDAENKAKDDEMWREAYEEERKRAEYEAEFNEWDFREEDDNRIGISLCVSDDHQIGNLEPRSPDEQTTVFGSATLDEPVDEFPEETPPEAPKGPGKKASSSAPVPVITQYTSKAPNKKTNKRKKKSETAQPLPFRIYHKNRGRSERIAMLQLKKFKFDEKGTGSTADKAFDVSDSD